MAEVKRGAENSFMASETTQFSTGEEEHMDDASGNSSAHMNEQTSNQANTTNSEEKENECIIEEENVYSETPTTSLTDSISSEIAGDTQMENVITINNDTRKETPELEESDDEETPPGDVTRQNVEDEYQEVYESNIDTLLKEAAVLASGIQENKTYVSYWDCGGDDEYHATNHIHLSSDAVYILAFNMSSMISDDGKGFPFMSMI